MGRQRGALLWTRIVRCAWRVAGFVVLVGRRQCFARLRLLRGCGYSGDDAMHIGKRTSIATEHASARSRIGYARTGLYKCPDIPSCHFHVSHNTIPASVDVLMHNRIFHL